MRLTLTFLILLLAGCGPSPSVPRVLFTESPRITVMTFNVKWLMEGETLAKRLKSKKIWGLEDRDEEVEIAAHHSAVADIIIKHSPDMICLQEVINEGSARRLAETLRAKGADYTLHFVNSRDSFLEQDIIFLTASTSAEPVEPTQKSAPSKCSILKCRIDGHPVAFVGIHLKSNPRSKSSVEKRNEQVSAIVKDLQELYLEGYDAIVLGDFNDWDPDVEDHDSTAEPPPASRVFTDLKDYQSGGGPELINCLKFVEPQKDRFTYDYKGSRTVLDHALIPVGWEQQVNRVFIDHDTPGDVSDHWPLVVSLGE